MDLSLSESTSYLKSKDETPLFYRHYPLAKSKASIFLVHGFGEHSGRYVHLINRLVEEKFEVSTLDLRGHGHSKGERGHICAFESYDEDVIAGLTHALKNQPNKKVFVLAHSMGALISLRVATHANIPIAGMVLSCPLLSLTMSMPSWKQWASCAAASLLPTLKVSSGIKGYQLSADEAIAKAYESDPLVLKNLSIRTFWEMFKSYQKAEILAKNISLSFLMQVGGMDSVVDTRASKHWFSLVNKKNVDATLKEYPTMRHEIYNEIEREKPIDDAISWLNARV